MKITIPVTRDLRISIAHAQTLTISLPDNLVLLPAVATPDMLEAMEGEHGQMESPHRYHDAQKRYKRMLRVAPPVTLGL